MDYALDQYQDELQELAILAELESDTECAHCGSTTEPLDLCRFSKLFICVDTDACSARYYEARPHIRPLRQPEVMR